MLDITINQVRKERGYTEEVLSPILIVACVGFAVQESRRSAVSDCSGTVFLRPVQSQLDCAWRTVIIDGARQDGLDPKMYVLFLWSRHDMSCLVTRSEKHMMMSRQRGGEGDVVMKNKALVP